MFLNKLCSTAADTEAGRKLFVCGPGSPDCVQLVKNCENIVTGDETWVCGYNPQQKIPFLIMIEKSTPNVHQNQIQAECFYWSQGCCIR